MPQMKKKHVYAVVFYLVLICAPVAAFPWGRLRGEKDEAETKTPEVTKTLDKQGIKPTNVASIHPWEHAEHKKAKKSDADAAQPAHDGALFHEQDSWNAHTRGDDHGRMFNQEAMKQHGQHGSAENHARVKSTTTGEAHSILPPHEEDRYSGIRKEIAELSKKLGPLPIETGRSPDDDNSHHEDGHVANNNPHANMAHAQHKLLTRGVEDAIAGLISVYKALRTHEHKADDNGNGMVHEAAHLHASMNASGGDIGGRRQEKKAAREGNGSDVVEPEKAKDSENSVTALAVLAGVVFIAAVVIMAMGYFQNRAECADQTQPLYPPRGPSFV